MRIMVTGSSGFIGSKIVFELNKLGHVVLPYDLPSDILDYDKLSVIISECDMVIHAAAKADVTQCIKELDSTFEVNVRGTYNVAKICAEQKKKLIFISTCCVYGNSIDELEVEFKTAPMCNEPYATSKVAGEAILRGMPYLDYVILRIGTVFGIGMRYALFTQKAMERLIKGEIVYIDGDGSQTRQLIYLDDLVDGICRTVNKFDDIKGEIINLCGKELTSALDTANMASEITGIKGVMMHREQRYGQTFHENISIEKAKKLLDWEPTTSFRDGMKFCYENDDRFK